MATVLGLLTSNSTSTQVPWLQRDQLHKKYRIIKDSMKFWTFTLSLTLTTAIQSLHKILQLMMMYHLIQFGCKRISSSVHMVVIFYCMSPHCDLELGDCKSFHMTLWPMTMHHLTRFCYKRFRTSEIITWTNIKTLNLCCDLDFDQNSQISSQTTLAYDHVPPNHVWLQKDQ